MKADYCRLWNHVRGIHCKETCVAIWKEPGVVLCHDERFCRTSPAFAYWRAIGAIASYLSTSRPSSAQPRVRAVSTAPPRCTVPPGVRSPTCRLAGRKPSDICRSVASSAGILPVHDVCLPSGFQLSSSSVAATVGRLCGLTSRGHCRGRPGQRAVRTCTGDTREPPNDPTPRPWDALPHPGGPPGDWAR